MECRIGIVGIVGPVVDVAQPGLVVVLALVEGRESRPSGDR
jgi:hypothetical protein